MYRVLGINDDVCTCECCGKHNLKCTVALSVLDVDGNDSGEIVRYGRDCAALAMLGRKSAANARKIEAIALAANHAAECESRQKLERVATDKNRANYLYACTRRSLDGSFFAHRGAEVVRVDGSDSRDVAFFAGLGFAALAECV